MFVLPFNTVSGKTRQISAGIFYTCADHIYGFVPPCRVLMDLLPLMAILLTE